MCIYLICIGIYDTNTDIDLQYWYTLIEQSLKLKNTISCQEYYNNKRRGEYNIPYTKTLCQIQSVNHSKTLF